VLFQRPGQVRQAELARSALDAGGDQFAHDEVSFRWVREAGINGPVPAIWS
jgi:hypothetical protein